MEKNSKLVMMEKGEIWKVLLKLGIPTMVGMMISALFVSVDGYFVGNLGKQQMAAVTVTTPLTYIITGLGSLLGGGGSIYIAKLLGQKNYKKANDAGSVIMDTSLIVGVIFVAILLIFMNPILRGLGASNTDIVFAKQYAQIFSISLFFNLFNVTCNNMLASEGATMYSMVAMLVSGISNVFLNPVFIYGLHMGIRGSGTATLVANILTTLVYLYYIGAKKGSVRYNFLNFKPVKEYYVETAKVGVVLMIFQLLYSASIAITNVLGAGYGDACVAAIGIEVRITSLGFMAITGFTKGFQSFVGFSFGAKAFDRVRSSKNIALIWTTAFCVICSVLMIIFAKPLVAIFNNDAQVVSIGVKALVYYSVTFMGMGFIMVYTLLFLATNQAKYGGIVSLARQGVILIPGLFILNAIFGMQGILLAQPLADGLTVLLILLLAYKSSKKLNQVAANA
ncbi:MATE family efflux transporter [Clostridium felsineum]|uniref:Multidrug export protein MepA n=1 Tax=Clostridium felsineum TaxID=36839 RepID=A0A1S8M9N3_9CLOT|nr:MATE family efflux transporter [Clostridium felsineum]MCR3757623.1 MATE family efflux transporter [Clostridium felsineum]URZ03220.1 Multidrug export protein MepA [Clostridium felsineum]URZ08441.1 Multidrug export protein MepA [Clostridium felsineum]URZ13472.1 Multidrug export protein MepA [Clostridium felsineum]URZ14557.1 Multidrug export protein MepA [Clostridium felsineum DSM 794]